jgi:hypothetical protein
MNTHVDRAVVLAPVVGTVQVHLHLTLLVGVRTVVMGMLQHQTWAEYLLRHPAFSTQHQVSYFVDLLI